MGEWIYNLDLSALHLLNVQLAHPWMDQFWLAMTQLHKLVWVQYAVLPVLLVLMFYRLRARALTVLLALGLAIGLSDTLCYRGIKSVVERARPFENPQISSWLRKVGDAHGPSFPSNHAANAFAGATVLAWYFRRWRFFFYSFATLVAASRPALGVHYPSDALAGAFIGSLCAWLLIALLFNSVNLFRLPPPVSAGNEDSGDWRLRSRRLSER